MLDSESASTRHGFYLSLPMRQTREAVRRNRRTRTVSVRWKQLDCTDDYRRSVARDVVALVVGYPQPPLDAPAALDVENHRFSKFSVQPLSLIVEGRTVAGFARVNADTVAFFDENGSPIAKNPTPDPAVPTIVRVSGKRRSPAINIRPGSGGLQRRSNENCDPLEGLEQFGPRTVRAVGQGGASLGIIECNPAGNTVVFARNSSDEDDDTILGQLRPALALVDQHPEQLQVRFILFGLEMKGWWPVRFYGPPAEPGECIREDMVQLGRWIHEGWLEHVVIRDLRRLAREAIEGGLIVRELMERQHIGLWASDPGRRFVLPQDRILLSFYNVLSQEDREHTVKKLQLAKLHKGPLAGNGWGTARFGFVRQRDGRLAQDMVQWPFIRRLHDLTEACLTAESPGTFASIVKSLADEGCPLSDTTVRKILDDDIYVTGDWSVNVRGLRVAQPAITLNDPVPAAQAHRNRELLALRQGRNDRTPPGSFLLNYVPTFHAQCLNDDEPAKARLRATRRGDRGPRGNDYYRHPPGQARSCGVGGTGPNGGVSWFTESLDSPIVSAVRDLVSNPIVLEQAALAVRHEQPEGPVKLDAEARRQLEAELFEQEQRLEALADEWVQKPLGETTGGLAAFEAFTAATRKRVRQIQARLSADQRLSSQTAPSQRPDNPDRVAAFLEILTEETPTDPFHLQLRARLFQRIVSRVIIDDNGVGPIKVTLEGALVPDPNDTRANPLLMAADLLDAYTARASAAEETNVITPQSFQKESAVITIGEVLALGDRVLTMTSHVDLIRKRRSALILPSGSWASSRAREGFPSWRRTLELPRRKPPTRSRIVAAIAVAGRPMSRRELVRDHGAVDAVLRRLVARGGLVHVPPPTSADPRRDRLWFSLPVED